MAPISMSVNGLLRPYPEEQLEARRVSARIEMSATMTRAWWIYLAGLKILADVAGQAAAYASEGIVNVGG
jgi:hypothetical protein